MQALPDTAQQRGELSALLPCGPRPLPGPAGRVRCLPILRALFNLTRLVQNAAGGRGALTGARWSLHVKATPVCTQPLTGIPGPGSHHCCGFLPCTFSFNTVGAIATQVCVCEHGALPEQSALGFEVSWRSSCSFPLMTVRSSVRQSDKCSLCSNERAPFVLSHVVYLLCFRIYLQPWTVHY